MGPGVVEVKKSSAGGALENDQASVPEFCLWPIRSFSGKEIGMLKTESLNETVVNRVTLWNVDFGRNARYCGVKTDRLSCPTYAE